MIVTEQVEQRKLACWKILLVAAPRRMRWNNEAIDFRRNALWNRPSCLNHMSSKAVHLRKTQTWAEVKLWQALRGRRLNGWKFRLQCPIDRFIIDFVCHDAKLVVEVDGATHGTADEQARDYLRTQTLEAYGFQVLRVTNADVFENLDGVRETILAAIEQPGAD